MSVGNPLPPDPGPDHALLQSARAVFSPDTPQSIAVAVSGGSDSVASLHLLARIAAESGCHLRAVTVDHGLRPEAATEAETVAALCKQLGVAHSILRWQHGQIAGNLMDAARRARYGLMADWAKAQGVNHIVLGHTADDQAETFLMGLARGAGLDGLTGMRVFWDQGNLRYLRPFLHHKRSALRDYLTRHDVAWQDDPSNDNDRFLRVKARKALKVLKPLGITVESLTGSMQNLQGAQAGLRASVANAAQQICQESAGALQFDGALWAETDAELRRRLLILALLWVSSAPYAPRAEAVARLDQAIAQGRDATLCGCRLRHFAGGFRLIREAKAQSGKVCGTDQLWDGRWRLDGPHRKGLELRALGAEGLRQCKDWRATRLPRDVLVTTPAIWYDQTLIAAPLAGFSGDWVARIVAGFKLFVLSH